MSRWTADDWRRREFLTRSALAGAAGLLGVAAEPVAADRWRRRGSGWIGRGGLAKRPSTSPKNCYVARDSRTCSM
jgi:hypothetical protein